MAENGTITSKTKAPLGAVVVISWAVLTSVVGIGMFLLSDRQSVFTSLALHERSIVAVDRRVDIADNRIENLRSSQEAILRALARIEARLGTSPSPPSKEH